MFVQYVTFRLDGLDVESYLAICDTVAPVYTGLDGCLGKLFIRDPDTATGFGGVYLWQTREQAEAYAKDGLLADLAARPEVVDLEVRTVEVLSRPTAVSAGALAALLAA